METANCKRNIPIFSAYHFVQASVSNFAPLDYLEGPSDFLLYNLGYLVWYAFLIIVIVVELNPATHCVSDLTVDSRQESHCVELRSAHSYF